MKNLCRVCEAATVWIILENGNGTAINIPESSLEIVKNS